MKSTIFAKIIDETTIEVQESFDVTVERLMQQQGICRVTDSYGRDLEFLCNKKGRVRVCHYSLRRERREYNRIYCVVGQVITEDNKTKVKIYSVHNRGYIVASIITIILNVLFVPLYILAISTSYYTPSKKDILIAILLILAPVYSMHLISEEKGNKYHNLEIMKNEIIKRVKAVDKWYD